MSLLLFQSLFGSFANCHKCSELSHPNNKEVLYSVLALENPQFSSKVSFVSSCQLFCNLKSLFFLYLPSDSSAGIGFQRLFSVPGEMLKKDIIPK